MPAETYADVERGNDDLAAWMKEAQHKKVLRLVEDVDAGKVQHVLGQYGDNLIECDARA